jgi:hypothetical protein
MIPALSAEERPVPPSDMSGWDDPPAPQDDIESPPHIDSPSIASDAPIEADWTAAETEGPVIDVQADETPVRPSKRGKAKPKAARRRGTSPSFRLGSIISLPSGCAAMAALIACLFIWRGDMVRLMPQTATYYRMFGFDVNLRGLAFKDVKLSSETVDGKPVMVIEGNIVADGKKPVDVPRLRFIVRDAKGTEIYAWNTVLDPTTLKPGDRMPFRSRLAAPPADGQTLDIRFFNSRDVAAGTA